MNVTGGKMSDIFIPSYSTGGDRRTDLLSESIVNSAIDMEAELGSLHAILYMRRHNIDMQVALRVIMRQTERRNSLAWSTSEPGGFCDFEGDFKPSLFKGADVFNPANHR